MIVGTEVEMSIGHRLMDYDGKCAHPHGHNYRVIVWLDGLNPNTFYPGVGILIDFGMLKAGLKEILEPLDHAMMLRQDDPLIPELTDLGCKLHVNNWNPTAENFALWLRFQIDRKFPGVVGVWHVKVYETSTSYAEV